MKRRDFIKGVGIAAPGLAIPLVAGAGRYFPRIEGEAWQTGCDTISEIRSDVATDREANFLNWKKKPTLDGTCSAGGENLCIPVNAQTFLDMLNQFATATQSDSTDFLYNGLRMYFAAGDQNNGNPAGLPSEQVGKLTVIFVPTVANSASATKGGGQDDPYQYWWLFNGTPYNFPQMSSAPTDNDTAYRWISNYRTNKANATNGLTAYGRAPGHSGKPQFQETNSLWYNRTSIFGGPVGDQADCGIMGYIQTRIASITSMTISFGAYGHKEIPPFTQYYYQLLAQFDIKTADETLYFGSSTGAKFFEKKHMKPLTDGTTDTGLPCPPADPCNGSL